MILPFKQLPGERADFARPVLDVALDGQEMFHAALLDTGALHNRFGRWVAQACGIDLNEGEQSTVWVGAVKADSVTVPVDLSVADMSWRAPVSFCDPWPFGFQLLGQEGFFRFFAVLLRAADYRLEVQPDPGGTEY